MVVTDRQKAKPPEIPTENQARLFHSFGPGFTYLQSPIQLMTTSAQERGYTIAPHREGDVHSWRPEPWKDKLYPVSSSFTAAGDSTCDFAASGTTHPQPGQTNTYRGTGKNTDTKRLMSALILDKLEIRLNFWSTFEYIQEVKDSSGIKDMKMSIPGSPDPSFFNGGSNVPMPLNANFGIQPFKRTKNYANGDSATLEWDAADAVSPPPPRP
jgi:hypothetical protein